MKVIREIKESRKYDFASGKAYFDVEKRMSRSGKEEALVDLCLGNTYKECGEICKKLITLLKE